MSEIERPRLIYRRLFTVLEECDLDNLISIVTYNQDEIITDIEFRPKSDFIIKGSKITEKPKLENTEESIKSKI